MLQKFDIVLNLFPELSNCSGIKTLKAIHDLFLFEDDLFRYEVEIIRNVPCAGMELNNGRRKI